MQLIRNDLLVLVGLGGSERLSLKERVRVVTRTDFRIRQRSGLCQMRGRIGGVEKRTPTDKGRQSQWGQSLAEG
jgi:hypothetical protein